MCRCSKTCSKVSVCLGLLLGVAGIALLAAGALSLANISINVPGQNLDGIEVSASIDGAMTGTLMAPSDLNCPYTIFIEKAASCPTFSSTAVITTGATLDTSLCGSEELPDEGPQRAPARRGLQDLDWTIGASETMITDLKLAATVTFDTDTDVTLTSGEDMWSMQLCDVFSEVFSVAGTAIAAIMVACGVVLLLAGLITFFIGLCCCCCCAAKAEG
ncbi:unnamed protein product [Symbiodinium natans]|uniref:Uncharacterized protein n=1 Tax=Symbiodinium natans TaxID=878477 RepID=A0A812LIH5_9DINO|nr:unnamed protein product [Symbiodinium natans]